MVWESSPSILQANPSWNMRRKCYIITWISLSLKWWNEDLVLEELAQLVMKIAWERFGYITQVYYKQIQWNMQKKCYDSLWTTLRFVWWTQSLGFEGTGYEECVGMFQVCSPSVLQANPMKQAEEMLCFPLKFPKFEVVNWKALIWRSPVWESDLILFPLKFL